jgi:diguanylate cyclase (GGDEF)-like protein
VLFIGLDNFKTVNDSLGHAAGDHLLIAASERLREAVRDGDTVARLGGDEFAVLLANVGDRRAAEAAAVRALEGLGRYVTVGERRVAVGASIGLAVAERHDSAQEMLRNADLALYEAKQAGKGRVKIYEAALHTAALRRLELEDELRHAIEHEQLEVHYQPIFAIGSQRLLGHEALVRWHHPQRGLLSPAEFLPIAEQTGLIVPLGRWVLRTACHQTATWQQRYNATLNIAVNLSVIQLDDPALVDDVRDALQTSGLPAHDLVLEVTETAVMRDIATLTSVMHDLKTLGTRLALDDFGTGYSSMSRLKGLPLDMLKIPKPFIDSITHVDDRAVAQGIIELGHRLRLGVVAEGIETAEQLTHLSDIGCDLAQGYHLARPAPAHDTEQSLKRLALQGNVPQAAATPGH